MLVVTRKPSETVLVDLSAIVPGIPPIEVMVVAMLDRQVRLGFNADKRIRIMRSEVVEREGWEKVSIRSSSDE